MTDSTVKFKHKIAASGALQSATVKELPALHGGPRAKRTLAEAAFGRWITMNFPEQWTERDIDEIAEGIAKTAGYFTERKAARRVVHA
jgi:hypothetical protein